MIAFVFPPFRHSLKKLFIVLAASLLAISAHTAIGQTRYVTDQLQAQVRAGTGLDYKITTFLTSGTEVTVLDADAGNGYSKIKSGDVSGFILTRLLSDNPIPREQLRQALENIKPLQDENQSLKTQMSDIKQQMSVIEDENVELMATNGQLKSSLERLQKTSENAVAIDQRNRVLEEENRALHNEIGLIRQENNSLKDNTQQKWFLLGALIAFAGLIVGLILPKLKLRPDQRYSNQL